MEQKTRSTSGLWITAICLALIGATLPAVARIKAAPATASALPACSTEQRRAWSDAVQRSAGAVTSDPLTVIGTRTATQKAQGLLNLVTHERGNWYPVDGTKHFVCGTLDKWSIYRGPEPERDLHAWLTLGDDFEYILDELAGLSKAAAKGTIYSEITPPGAFREWFFGSHLPLPLLECDCAPDNTRCCQAVAQEYVGGTACVYGPWVTEEFHHWIPEIHPMEQFWTRNVREHSIDVFVMRDASLRFDDAQQFGRPAARGWQPWAGHPTRARFRVAVALPVSGARNLVVRAFGPHRVAGPVENREVRASDGIALQLSSNIPIEAPAVESACVAQTGSQPDVVHAFVRLGVQTGASDLLALRISGSVLPQVDEPTPPEPRAAPPSLQAEGGPSRPCSRDAVVPTLLLRSVESDDSGRYASSDLSSVYQDRPSRAADHLPLTRTAWDIGPNESIVWRRARSQKMHLTAAYQVVGDADADCANDANRALADGSTLMNVFWQLSAQDLEESKDLPVKSQPDTDSISAELQHGRYLAMSMSRPAGASNVVNVGLLRRRDRVADAALTVWFPNVVYLGSVLTKARSVRLVARAELVDSAGRKGTFEQELFNYAPLAAGSGWEIPSFGGAFPGQLRDALVSWLAHALPPARITTAALAADAALPAVEAVESELLGNTAQAVRDYRRKARIVWLTGLTAMEDATITPTELALLKRMALDYAKARLAATRRSRITTGPDQ